MKKLLLSAITLLLITCQVNSQTWSDIYSANDESGTPMDRFGQSVSLSGDGSYAIVGANGALVGSISEQGKAFIYFKSGSSWTVQDTLVAPDPGFQDGFGFVTDISDDGTIAIVGAPYNDIDTNTNQGKCYVFSRSGNKWNFQSELTAPDGKKGELFGWSLSLSEDGSTVIVGSKDANQNLGKAYVFTRSGDTWTYQAGLIANDRKAGDNFGEAVKLSADGNLAFVGAGKKTIVASIQQGKVYVFQRTGTVWQMLTTILSSEPQLYDQFGASLDISKDGSTAIIASANRNKNNVSNKNEGKVYIFQRSGNNWVQQAGFEAYDAEAKDYFGNILSISHDGNIAFIGAGHKTINNLLHQGKVYVYMRKENTWSLLEDIFSPEPLAYDYFGASLSLSGDGKTAIIGAPLRRAGQQTPQGTVYFYGGSTITNVINFNNDQIAVYPNPANDFVLINLNNKQQAEIEILNMDGKVIQKEIYKSGEKIQLNAEDPAGIYFLRIKQSEKISVHKILKR